MRLGAPAVLVLAATVIAALYGRVGAQDTVPAVALYGSPAAIGRLLFRDFLLPFEITSVLILIAILGAVLLARREG